MDLGLKGKKALVTGATKEKKLSVRYISTIPKQ